MALYDQEVGRIEDCSETSYWSGKKLWKEDQLPRLKKKGKKACVERNVGECFQWKAHGPCSEGDSCSFSHDPSLASGNQRW